MRIATFLLCIIFLFAAESCNTLDIPASSVEPLTRKQAYVNDYNSKDLGRCIKGIKGLLSISDGGRDELVRLLESEFFTASTKRRLTVLEALFSIDNAGIEVLSGALNGGKEEAEYMARLWKQNKESFIGILEKRRILTTILENGYRRALCFALDIDFDVNTKLSRHGLTLLNRAIHHQQRDIAFLLIERGANMNPKGPSPLLAAAQEGQTEIAHRLISKGAQVNPKVPEVDSPLFFAVQNGHKETAALLISKGAKIDRKESDFGRTPLHCAAYFGHNDIILLLLSKGAGVNAKNNLNHTPLDNAKNDEVKSLLRDYGGKTSRELKKETEKKK